MLNHRVFSFEESIELFKDLLIDISSSGKVYYFDNSSRPFLIIELPLLLSAIELLYEPNFKPNLVLTTISMRNLKQELNQIVQAFSDERREKVLDSIIRLLEKFELIFSLSNDAYSDVSLFCIPCLLEKLDNIKEYTI